MVIILNNLPMGEPTFTIRVAPEKFPDDTTFVAMADIDAVCQKFGVKMEVVENKYFEFTTDDVKNFFFLGLNFPKY